MKLNQLLLRCYAEPDGGVWIAVCVDLSLAVQGDSFEEVRRKLDEQIKAYVYEALSEDREYAEQLLARRSPWQDWLKYYLIRWQNFSPFKAMAKTFKDPLPPIYGAVSG